MMPDTTNHHDETAAASQGNGAPRKPAQEDSMRRAEEMIDNMGEQVGQFAAKLGHQLLRFTARAREELEDIWAEAQSLRRGDRS